MELEETIKDIKVWLEFPVWFIHTGKDEDFLRRIDKSAIETALKYLEKYRDLYIQSLANNLNQNLKNKEKSNEQLEALNEGWKLEVEKREKMIELMAEYIMYKVPFTKETRCLELKEDARTLNSVKQYFEKKAEEQLTDENKG